MIVLGLTGSIGMGKSTAAATFRFLRVPVYDADAEIHRLLGRGGAAVKRVGKAFPGVVRSGAVDRQALGKKVFTDPAKLRTLESILHPMARVAQKRFLAAAMRRREPIVVLDIPLLFETGGDANCDATLVVTAPAFLQRMRVLRRPGMTQEKFAAILAKQMPDAEKRRRADFVVQTGLDKRHSLMGLRAVIGYLLAGK